MFKIEFRLYLNAYTSALFISVAIEISVLKSIQELHGMIQFQYIWSWLALGSWSIPMSVHPKLQTKYWFTKNVLNKKTFYIIYFIKVFIVGPSNSSNKLNPIRSLVSTNYLIMPMIIQNRTSLNPGSL